MNYIPEIDSIILQSHHLPSRECISPKFVLEQICSKLYPYVMRNIITILKGKQILQFRIYKTCNVSLKSLRFF